MKKSDTPADGIRRGDSCGCEDEGRNTSSRSFYDAGHKNPLIPPNARSEADVLTGVRRCDYRMVLGRLKLMCHFGKMRRIIVAGMPYFVPVEANDASL